MGTSCTLNWRNNIFNRTSSRLPYIQSISVMSLSVICLTGFIALWDMRLNWFNHRWIIYIHLIMNLPPHVPPLPCHVLTFHQKPLPTLNCTIQSCHLKCRSRGFVSVCWWVGVFASLHINPHLHISIIQFSPKRRVTGGAGGAGVPVGRRSRWLSVYLVKTLCCEAFNCSVGLKAPWLNNDPS